MIIPRAYALAACLLCTSSSLFRNTTPVANADMADNGTCEQVTAGSADSTTVCGSDAEHPATEGDESTSPPDRTSAAAIEAAKKTNPTCTLYLAKSTIPNAGMGMYTGVDLSKGNHIAPGDLCIPNIDFEWHNDKSDKLWLWSEYDWLAVDMGVMANEGVHIDDVRGNCPGFGAAINCHMALNNVEEETPLFDSAGLHRSKDPGVGAFTSYHNRAVKATKDTPAGAELFVFYGENWFETREETYGKIPFWDNYSEADKILEKYASVKAKLTSIHNPITPEIERDLWKIATNLPYESRTTNALPKSWEDIAKATELGTTEVLLPDSTRSIEWLEENGKCMDNIMPGNSTIKQAGRGAFATRFIPKGGLVSPAPLIHIPDADVLNVYNWTTPPDEPENWIKNENIIKSRQLLVNYCFGHRHSTLLLSVYGHLVAHVNHNSESPNAKIVWADKSLNHNPDWLNLSVNELGDRPHQGLAFDFVATRNIFPGEEIFIDYGPEWQKAWDDHVRNWVTPEDSELFQPANIWNSDTTTPLKTQEEQELDPYPSNVEIMCHPDVQRQSPKNLRKWSESGILGERFTTVDRNEFHPCTITGREVLANGQIVYTADVNNHMQKHYKLRQVPREAFAFVDRPYSSDVHLDNVFRHPIMIPDEIFPDAWKNKK